MWIKNIIYLKKYFFHFLTMKYKKLNKKIYKMDIKNICCDKVQWLIAKLLLCWSVGILTFIYIYIYTYIFLFILHLYKTAIIES